MTLRAQSISIFDIWRERYGGAQVEILRAATNQRANVFLDPELTEPADNPQTLLSLSVVRNGSTSLFGKWAAPIYANEPVYLRIDGVDVTGIVRPAIVSLQDEDASFAIATTVESLYQRRLKDRFSDFVIARDFGQIADSPLVNTETLNRAIGACASRGGGIVLLPAGDIVFTTLTLPQRVVLLGAGRDVTTLISQEGSTVVTLGGDYSGLEGLTLDGVNLIPDSIGVYAESGDSRHLRDVTIKRFDVGMKFVGGQFNRWENLDVSNCGTGAELRGDLNSGSGSGGSLFAHNAWIGGAVSLNANYGVRLFFVDLEVKNNSFQQVKFDGNFDIALLLHGARYTSFYDCLWEENFINLTIEDDTNTALVDINTTIGCYSFGGLMNGGTVEYFGDCINVQHNNQDFVAVTFELNSPQNSITLRDCTEDAQVTSTGTSTKLLRDNTSDKGSIYGVSTDASALVAYSYTIPPGGIVNVEAKVKGRQRNGQDYGVYHVASWARRPPSQLLFQAQTANFTLGAVLTGALSGAVARINDQTDSGTSGTLNLIDIVGEFQNGETITDSAGGSATANGVLAHQSAVLLGSTTAIQAAVETDATWDVAFSVLGGDIRLSVQGAAAMTVEWTVGIDLST